MTEISAVRRVALHEAGHAVARYLYGRWHPDHVRRFKTITVTSDEGEVVGHSESWMSSDGVLDLDYSDIGTWDARTRRRIEHHIMVFLAGMVIEDLYDIHDNDEVESVTLGDGRTEDVYIGRSLHDLQRALDLADLAGGSQETRDAYIEWLRLRTRDFLTSPPARGAVEGLADVLEEKGTLGYREAVEVIQASIDRQYEELTSQRSVFRRTE